MHFIETGGERKENPVEITMTGDASGEQGPRTFQIIAVPGFCMHPSIRYDGLAPQEYLFHLSGNLHAGITVVIHVHMPGGRGDHMPVIRVEHHNIRVRTGYKVTFTGIQSVYFCRMGGQQRTESPGQ